MKFRIRRIDEWAKSKNGCKKITVWILNGGNVERMSLRAARYGIKNELSWNDYFKSKEIEIVETPHRVLIFLTRKTALDEKNKSGIIQQTEKYIEWGYDWPYTSSEENEEIASRLIEERKMRKVVK